MKRLSRKNGTTNKAWAMTRKRRSQYEQVYKHFPSFNFLQDFLHYVNYFGIDQDFCLAILPKGLTMARNNAFTQIKFCNIRLSDTSKRDFKKWVESDDYDLDALLEHLIDTGNKVSLSSDDKRATYIASFTCKDEQSPNSDCCVVSRAPTLGQAIGVMLYKFFVLLRDATWSNFAVEDDWG